MNLERVASKNVGKDFVPIKKPKLAVWIVVAVLVTAICLGLYIISILEDTKMYKGVTVGGVSIENMSKADAMTFLEEKHFSKLEDKVIAISAEDFDANVRLGDLSAQYEVNTAVDEAYKIGRNGSVVSRLGTIYNTAVKTVSIPVTLNWDAEKLKEKVDTMATEANREMKNNEIVEKEGYIEIVRGVNGRELDKEKLVDDIYATIQDRKFENVKASFKIIEPDKLDVDKIFAEYCYEPQNAKAETVHYKLNIVPQKPGITFDKDQAKQIISEQKDSYQIPLTYIPAEVDAADIEQRLFKDKLASFTTNYNPGQADRTHNVTLATRKIDGCVLAPGEVFSYNDAVGERTYEEGYKDAKVYVKNQIVDGLAGGICQVSSTLYNVALLSALEIVDRSCHSLTVSYVPLGQDATVAYGSVDFKFKNNTDDFIKLKTSIGDGKLYMEVVGTKPADQPIVEIQNDVKSVIPAKTKTVENKNMTKGATVTKQSGSPGYEVDSYRILSRDGQVIKKEYLGRSIYNATDTIIEVGSKVVAPPAAINPPATTNVGVPNNQQNPPARN